MWNWEQVQGYDYDNWAQDLSWEGRNMIKKEGKEKGGKMGG